MCRRSALLRATWRFVPSIRDRINLAKVYRHALRALPETVDGQASLPVSETCPVTLDELLSDEPVTLIHRCDGFTTRRRREDFR